MSLLDLDCECDVAVLLSGRRNGIKRSGNFRTTILLGFVLTSVVMSLLTSAVMSLLALFVMSLLTCGSGVRFELREKMFGSGCFVGGGTGVLGVEKLNTNSRRCFEGVVLQV